MLVQPHLESQQRVVVVVVVGVGAHRWGKCDRVENRAIQVVVIEPEYGHQLRRLEVCGGKHELSLVSAALGGVGAGNTDSDVGRRR